MNASGTACHLLVSWLCCIKVLIAKFELSSFFIEKTALLSRRQADFSCIALHAGMPQKCNQCVKCTFAKIFSAISG